MTTTPETPQPTPQLRQRTRRRGGTPLDMVRSLGLVGLVVVGMVAFTFFGQPDHPPVTVDVKATVQAARQDAQFPVLAMTTLPDRWYANFASLSPNVGGSGPRTFHIGYITEDAQYFALDAATTDTPVNRGDAVVRTESVAGLTFAVYGDAGAETWIRDASAEDGYSITLTGSGSTQQWRMFVTALRSDGPIAS